MAAHVGGGELPGHDAIVTSLIQGAQDIQAGRSSATVTRTGLFLDYNIFIPLSMPEG